jgi:Rrf2 family protein
MASGQFFSQRFGYAVHALGYLAKKPFGSLTALPELAAWMRTVWPSASETYLANVIQRLARGGVLRSHRGIAGGYSLARPADKITLREVMEVIDGVCQDYCTLSLGSSCPAQGTCSIQGLLHDVEIQYMESLARIDISTVADKMSIPCPKNE